MNVWILRDILRTQFFMRTATFHLLLLLMCLPVALLAESITARNIAEGKLIPGSTSPDQKFCLLDVQHGDSSGHSTILATTDRKANLGAVLMIVRPAQDPKQLEKLTLVWSADSQRIALHDSSAKHSELQIYRLVDGRFQRLATHDLLAAACGHWGIARSNVVSSGQRPVKWPVGDRLHVEVSGRLQDGKRLRTTFLLHAPLTGPSIQQ